MYTRKFLLLTTEIIMITHTLQEPKQRRTFIGHSNLRKCLQNKAFETVYIYCKINVLLQFYTDTF